MTSIEQRGYVRPEILVSTDWVESHRDDPNVRIAESNEDPLLYPSGHVPGAVEIDWVRDLNDPLRRDYLARDGFEALMRRIGATPDTTIVFYGDKNNWWACYAFWVFQLFGHTNARIMDGGRVKWEKEGRSLVRDVPTFAPSDYSAPERDDATLRAFRDQVLEHLRAGRGAADLETALGRRGRQLRRRLGGRRGLLGSPGRWLHAEGSAALIATEHQVGSHQRRGHCNQQHADPGATPAVPLGDALEVVQPLRDARHGGGLELGPLHRACRHLLERVVAPIVLRLPSRLGLRPGRRRKRIHARLDAEKRVELVVQRAPVQLAGTSPIATLAVNLAQKPTEHAARRRAVERNERRLQIIAQSRQRPLAIARPLLDQCEQHLRHAGGRAHEQLAEEHDERAARFIGRVRRGVGHRNLPLGREPDARCGHPGRRLQHALAGLQDEEGPHLEGQWDTLALKRGHQLLEADAGLGAHLGCTEYRGKAALLHTFDTCSARRGRGGSRLMPTERSQELIS